MEPHHQPRCRQPRRVGGTQLARVSAQAAGPVRPLAEIYADRIDWHQVVRLVQRGCPPWLAPHR
jgi:hypothetical protein